MSRPSKYTAAHDAILRAGWLDSTKSIADIGKLLGKSTTGVQSRALALNLGPKVRKAAQVRGHAKGGWWNDEREAQLRKLIAAGYSSKDTAEEMRGLHGAIVSKAKRLKLKFRRQPAAEKPAAAPKPSMEFSRAPLNFPSARPAADTRPVPDRILAELAKAPRSTMTLATLLDVKESVISSELRVLRYQGRAVEGEGSERARLWSLAMEMAA